MRQLSLRYQWPGLRFRHRGCFADEGAEIESLCTGGVEPCDRPAGEEYSGARGRSRRVACRGRSQEGQGCVWPASQYQGPECEGMILSGHGVVQGKQTSRQAGRYLPCDWAEW